MGRQLEKFEIEGCTRAAYEAHRVFCESMGDNSHVPWDKLTDDLKEVARQATIGIATLDHNAKQSHDAWVAAKRAQGWTFDTTKSQTKKTHPCLVGFEDLSYEQQAKDELWLSTVKNLITAFIRIPRQ